MKNSNRTQKKQSSRVLYCIAALVISIAVISCNGVGPFDGGGISTEEDFQKMRDNPSGNFFLVNDITLTENFEPIGDASKPFTGTFEGNGKTIRDLKILKPGENDIGIFGYIGAGGEVRNLRLILADGDATTPSIEGNNNVGALAGWNHGSISNVGVEGGYVKGNSHTAGGLAGESSNPNSIITGSYATVTVEGLTHVGGLVGWLNYGVVRDSYATGTVTGTTNVGGLIGSSDYDDEGNRSIKNTYATGAVTGTTNVGGLIGNIYILTNPSADRIVANYFDAQSTNPNGPELQTFNLANTQGGLTLPVVTAFHTHTDGQVYTAADGSGGLIQQSNFPDWDFTGDSTDGNEDHWHWSGDGMWPRLAWQQ